MNTTQEIIDDLKQGKIVIIMDDEDRENEGDLLMIAEHVRPQDINFMASYGRGLICLTLTRERCQQLRLPLMVNDNQAAYSTNFTVSIEAAEGVTTGISAADRAKTVLAAVKPDAKPTDVVQPGHIFPLMAQPGGVLNRTGHTEAGCDLARLAGFEPAAVIVEILNDDGTMARRDDLRMFAEKHELKIGTIADLIHYRIQNEKTIELVSSCDYPTKYGDFRLHAFQDEIDNKLHLALTYGDVSTDEPVMVRINAKSTLADLLQAKENDHYPLPSAMQKIADEGRGALILIPQPMVDSREVGVGCQILTELGIKNLKLLGTPTKYSGLAGFDIEIVEHVPLD
jgi:3,4-dihydroxy 2-butanone 4-phosphate synthase/GTP cyclohydrolase II